MQGVKQVGMAGLVVLGGQPFSGYAVATGGANTYQLGFGRGLVGQDGYGDGVVGGFAVVVGHGQFKAECAGLGYCGCTKAGGCGCGVAEGHAGTSGLCPLIAGNAAIRVLA